MAGKKFKQRKTDVIQGGIVYRMDNNNHSKYKGTYYVYTYTDDLPESVVVADRIGDVPVTFLDTKSFRRSSCRTIVIPDSILGIGSEAFASCSNLETLRIPSGINFVAYDAFEKCRKLNHTSFCYGRYLGNDENPFLILHTNERAVKSNKDEELVVEIHPETKFILSSAFNHYSPDSALYDKPDKLILHDKLEHIDGGAFSFGFYGFDYAKVETIYVDSMECLCRGCNEIPGQAKTLIVGGEVLGDTITIPASVTEIAYHCFYKYDKVKTIRFEGNISKIGCEAFWDCKNLKEVYFPQKIGTIECGAFSECPALEKVELFEVDKIGSCAFELDRPSWPGKEMKPRSDGLHEVNFRNRVGTLCDNAFSYNAMLETVTGMENVENIEGDPFVGTPFKNKQAQQITFMK